ncbi:MAG TPA: sodium/solute symporter [Vicinamibacteria bacterium]|nr:sodium/solute symporter [Vicinamibacteria bacterium]
MSESALYTLILGVYFAAMLSLGFWFGRRVRTDRDYFIARGKLGPATIGFSFSATQMSGSSYMGAVGTQSVLGYAFIPAGVSSASAPWFSYILLGDRLRKIAGKMESVTLVDVFEKRYYSNAAGLVATFIMLVAFVPMISAQLKAAGNVFEVLLGVPYVAGLFLFGGIVILYTVLGGMFAVAWTDLIQGVIMIVGFAILAPVAVGAAGGFSEMHRQYSELNPGGISFLGNMPAVWVVSSFVVWGFFQIGGAPASVTRFLIPEDDQTLRAAMVYSVTFQSFIYLCAGLVAISGGVLLPNLAQPDLTVPTLITELLHPVVGGVIVAAILGATMSTIDSTLLLAGSLAAENVYTKLERLAGREVEPRAGLRIARRATLAIGLLALVVSIKPPAAILWIVTIAFSLMASAFTFPFLLGLWWPRATKEGGIAGMIGGSLACVSWYVAGYLEYQSFDNWIGGIWPAIFGPFVSLLLVVVVSKLTAPPPQEIRELFFDSGSTGPELN